MSGKKTRRNVLRTGIASVAGLSTLSSITTGDSGQQKEINTDFNPQSEEELKEFISNLLELRHSKQEDVYSNLSADQREEVAEGLKLEKVEMAVINGTESVVTSSTNSYSRTFIQSGQSTIGENIWDYHHKITYEYTGSGCPIDVTDVSHSTWATSISLGWSYDGDVSDSTDIIDGGCGGSEEARALTQGKFTYALNGVAYTANPMSRLAGSTQYDFDNSEYAPDAWVVEQRCDYCNGIVGDG